MPIAGWWCKNKKQLCLGLRESPWNAEGPSWYMQALNFAMLSGVVETFWCSCWSRTLDACEQHGDQRFRGALVFPSLSQPGGGKNRFCVCVFLLSTPKKPTLWLHKSFVFSLTGHIRLFGDEWRVVVSAHLRGYGSWNLCIRGLCCSLWLCWRVWSIPAEPDAFRDELTWNRVPNFRDF